MYRSTVPILPCTLHQISVCLITCSCAFSCSVWCTRSRTRRRQELVEGNSRPALSSESQSKRNSSELQEIDRLTRLMLQVSILTSSVIRPRINGSWVATMIHLKAGVYKVAGTGVPLHQTPVKLPRGCSRQKPYAGDNGVLVELSQRAPADVFSKKT